MDRCSYFIREKALFGSFPNQEAVELLEKEGVRVFVDLTAFCEQKTQPYYTQYTYIKYPILDNRVPHNWRTFAALVAKICNIIFSLKEGEKIYIHCKGGHGRSGVLVACILCYMNEVSPEDALEQTRISHSTRKDMKEKWRKIGSPQSKRQKDFVHKFFSPIMYGNPNKIRHDRYSRYLSNFSDVPVEVPELGMFPTLHKAFLALKSSERIDILRKILGRNVLPKHSCTASAWKETKVELMYRLLDLKFSQNLELRRYLVNTGLRPMIRRTENTFWAVNDKGEGKNIHGRILVKLREKYLLEEFDREKMKGSGSSQDCAEKDAKKK